ncbi:cytochrome b/b6 domain-containing protein [Actibacterium lipolyticum]|uniref:Lipid/polyisoprenoid-binding YceI-like domain-containing protein n=1 Tax=Actibacterium lipolyticum TaxID=1524263 RepID=A0A238L8B0_9RHOB|nr:cytochrome b/b6 domain-containing protein [Actibacterium lipolyticum]SMX51070.1 hypothetical protein COL8621_03600 [Actibacterium lipolyticum]
MPLSNTNERFGSVSKAFHWLTALLIITLIPLGIIANDMGFDTSEALARKAFLFSLHKTLGVTVFFVALLRILWAFTQTRPGFLNTDKPAETFMAEMVHWLLYAALVLVPLTGWIHHAATTGFAPIWWPFGQELPFVPKSENLAETFSALHIIFERVLLVSILLHVAGALKHHFVDRDATLKRMWFATKEAPQTSPHTTHHAPRIAAVFVYVLAIGIGAAMGLLSHHDDPVTAQPQLASVDSGWTVQDGTLGIQIHQFGSTVDGSFTDWTAAINFTEQATNGVHGDVTVEISIPSLTLGSVTSQALGPDFFDAATFATATFNATIEPHEAGYAADGTLTLKGQEMPVTLLFDLTIEGDTATMSGKTTLDRRDFAIGNNYADESSLAFPVEVTVNLTAVRTQ